MQDLSCTSHERVPCPDRSPGKIRKAVGFRLDEPFTQPLLSRYANGEATRRYYQDAAIRVVLEKIAQCEQPQAIIPELR